MSSDLKLSHVKLPESSDGDDVELETTLGVSGQIQGDGWQEVVWNAWEQ